MLDLFPRLNPMETLLERDDSTYDSAGGSDNEYGLQLCFIS